MCENIFKCFKCIQPVLTEVVVGGHAQMVDCCLMVCRTNILLNIIIIIIVVISIK